MERVWNVFLYQSPKGQTPLNDFILGLEIRAQAKVRNAINLLKLFGFSVGSLHTKKLTGSDLWELRILGSDNIRILYIAVDRKTFLLLHGFKKKSNHTPAKEITVAEKRLTEFRSRK